MNFTQKERYTINDLLDIMVLLRAPDGCPWDRVQTHASIRRNMIEEAYEAVDAIDQNNTAGLLEELGDVLMQVVFHAQIEQEHGSFRFDDVADGVCKKLVFRHPNVFGSVAAANGRADDETAAGLRTGEQMSADGKAILDWETQKRLEKAHLTQADAMRSVPRMFPALIRSAKLQEKAARSGVDWPSAAQALDETEQALRGARETLSAEDPAARRAAFGQLLFAAVGAARLSAVEPEEALARTSDAFVDAFAAAETGAAQGKTPLSGLTPSQLR